MSDVDHEARALAKTADGKGDLALHKLDSHEEICAVRYEGIQSAVADIKKSMEKLGDQYAGGINRVHDRIDQGQKRLIFWLSSVAGGLAIGLGSVVFFMITKTP